MLMKRILLVAFLFLIPLGIWTLWGNTVLEVNEYEVVHSYR